MRYLLPTRGWLPIWGVLISGAAIGAAWLTGLYLTRHPFFDELKTVLAKLRAFQSA